MHLLKLNSDGKPSLTQFIAGDIPNYAILSHTWEADDQEVTFTDLADHVDRDDEASVSLRQRGAASDYDDSEVFVTSRREYEPRYDVEAYAAGDPLCWDITLG